MTPESTTLKTPKRLIITWSSPDQVGLLASITQIIASQRANLLEVLQHTDQDERWFFLRIEADIENLSPQKIKELKISLEEKSQKLSKVNSKQNQNDEPISRLIKIGFTYEGEEQRVALLGSKLGHCLADLLWRWRDGELPMKPTVIISNHQELKPLANQYQVPFEYIPIRKDSKKQDFEALHKILKAYNAQTLVLARYMQIIPKDLCKEYENKIINIHHSFLPSFAGADPYGQALRRGVKLIGATAHYATEVLDEGPIIEQEVRRVKHHHTKNDLLRLGQDCERLALSKGLLLHLQSRIFVHKGKTIVLGD